MRSLLLTLTLMSLFGCSKEKSHAPLFYKNQEVVFVVDYFFSRVCSGNGTVIDYSTPTAETVIYTIRTSLKDEDCPVIFQIKQEDLKAK